MTLGVKVELEKRALMFTDIGGLIKIEHERETVDTESPKIVVSGQPRHGN